MPRPLDAVITRLPAADAPITMLMEAISHSAWMKTLPMAGNRRAEAWAISLAGVIGYPK